MYWAMAPYSDMSLLDGDTRDENSYLYEILNQSFHGDLISSASQQPAKVTSFAVSNKKDSGGRGHAFSLINRTANPQRVKLHFDSWRPTNLLWNLWDGDNAFSKRKTTWGQLNNGEFVLSPYSVNFFVE